MPSKKPPLQQRLAWRLGVGGAILAILGSLLTLAFSDSPLSTVRLQDGRTIKAFAVGKREVLHGALWARLLYRLVPEAYRDRLGVAAYSNNSGDNQLWVWTKCSPPLPDSETLMVLPLDGGGNYGQPEDVDSGFNADEYAPVGLDYYPRRGEKIKLRLFSRRRSDDGWSPANTPFTQPKEELRPLGEIMVANPEGAATAQWKSVDSLPAQHLQRGITLELLEVHSLPSRQAETIPRDHIRLKCRLFRQGHPTQAWGQWLPLEFRDATGNSFATHPTNPNFQPFDAYDLELPRLRSEPTLELENTGFFAGSLKDLPEGVRISEVRNLTIPPRGKTHTLAPIREANGVMTQITVFGDGVPLQPKGAPPPNSFSLGFLPPDQMGPFLGLALELMDQRGRRIELTRKLIWRLSPSGIGLETYDGTLPRGATHLTLRFVHVPPITWRLRFPNPYYGAGSSR